MKRLLSVIGLIIFFGILCFVLLFIWIFANPETNVRFQSSDGQWHDQEVLFKGREFESIVVYFELYKLKCDRPDAKLQRVTTKPGTNELAYWFDDYDDPKWRVPLAEKLPEPPYNKENCLYQSVKPEMFETADINARKFIDGL